MPLMQGFGQQSGSNSGANQGSYGAPEAGPGIDQSLSAHVPGGQGVSTATEQVTARFWLLLYGKQMCANQADHGSLTLECRALAG